MKIGLKNSVFAGLAALSVFACDKKEVIEPSEQKEEFAFGKLYSTELSVPMTEQKSSDAKAIITGKGYKMLGLDVTTDDLKAGKIGVNYGFFKGTQHFYKNIASVSETKSEKEFEDSFVVDRTSNEKAHIKIYSYINDQFTTADTKGFISLGGALSGHRIVFDEHNKSNPNHIIKVLKGEKGKNLESGRHLPFLTEVKPFNKLYHDIDKTGKSIDLKMRGVLISFYLANDHPEEIILKSVDFAENNALFFDGYFDLNSARDGGKMNFVPLNTGKKNFPIEQDEKNKLHILPSMEGSSYDKEVIKTLPMITVWGMPNPENNDLAFKFSFVRLNTNIVHDEHIHVTLPKLEEGKAYRLPVKIKLLYPHGTTSNKANPGVLVRRDPSKPGHEDRLNLKPFPDIHTIDASLFEGSEDLDSMVISEFITTIKANAFKDCENLEKVDLSYSKKLKTIGQSAFEGCTKIDSLYFLEALETIGAKAFKDCTALAKVDFTRATGLKSIGESAFENCTALIKRIMFPPNLTKIDKKAFKNCSGLDNVDFSRADNLQVIGESAFEDSNLSGQWGTLVIKQKVTTIEKYAFKNCKRITLIDLSAANSIRTIGESAFEGCSALGTTGHHTLWLRNTIQSIGANAFKGTSFHKIEIDWSDNNITIGENAFYGANSVKEIIIRKPDGLKGDLVKAFNGLPKPADTEKLKIRVPHAQIESFKTRLHSDYRKYVTGLW